MNETRTRKSRGGQPSNTNRRLKVPWSSSYDLNSAQGIAAFTKELIKLTLTGQVSSHTADSIARQLKLLEETEVSVALDERLEKLEDKRRRGEKV